MAQFFDRPFASGGTRTNFPIETTSTGEMSFIEGWGYDYERNPLKDDKARRIERAKMNYLFYIITEAIGELQRQGSSMWEEERAPYGLGVTCYFGNATWVSKKANNNDKPGLTDAWLDISIGGGGSSGGDFDPTKYYTKQETENLINQIAEQVQELQIHENGDIYPISRHTLIENEYICNGDTIPIGSNVGIVLNTFPEAFKTSWGIKKIGTTLIKLPSIVGAKDYDKINIISSFSPTPGYDGPDNGYIYNGELSTGGDVSVPEPWLGQTYVKFLPVMWLDPKDVINNNSFQVLFEGIVATATDPVAGPTISQLRFGVYDGGLRFVDEEVAATATVPTLILYNSAGSGTNASVKSVVLTNNETGIFVTITLAIPMTAVKMTTMVRVTLPGYGDDGGNKIVTLNLTQESLI